MSVRRKILFVFRRQRAHRLQLVEQRIGPDEMLYGLHAFDSSQYDTDFIEGDDQRWSLIRCLTYPFEYLVARVTMLGFALHITLENLQALRQADVIVSTNDSCGLPIALMKKLRLLKTPMLYISQGLSDRVVALSATPFLHRLIHHCYRTLLGQSECIIVLGEGAAKHLTEVFNLQPNQVQSVPFGIDAFFWQPSGEQAQGDFILSVGSDLARDYGTLLQAIDQESLRIVTRLSLSQAELKSKVEVGTDYSDIELRELYQQAKFVVTPLHDVAQPTGQSATLQAMACGKAVILSAIQGLWEAQYLRHMETCYLVKPGDVSELQKAMAYLSAHPAEATRIGQNARRLVEERYTSQHFAQALERYIDAMQKG